MQNFHKYNRQDNRAEGQIRNEFILKINQLLHYRIFEYLEHKGIYLVDQIDLVQIASLLFHKNNLLLTKEIII